MSTPDREPTPDTPRSTFDPGRTQRGGLIQVVGIGADGIEGLSEHVREIIHDGQVIFGSPRQLAAITATDGQELVAWPRPLLPALRETLDQHKHKRRVVLASGDPLRSGIGTTLISVFGSGNIRIIPTVSSDALARARLGWSAESSDVITVVGRRTSLVLRALAPGRRLVVLSSDEATPREIARLLTDAGYGPTTLTVLGNLGGPTESALSGTARQWSGSDVPEFPRLNVVCCECQADPDIAVLPTIAGLPDTAYEHDGQLTKREIRASALAHLAPSPGHLLWDVGAGAGSIAIEWMRADARAQAIAIEKSPDRAAAIRRNADRLGVPDLHVVTGDAPDAFVGLPTPQAIFIGGGATAEGLLDACWSALGARGRLVVHAVTVQTEALLHAAQAKYGGELVRVSVEYLQPIGSFSGWAPSRAVTQWSATRPARNS
ncbi:precorrin-6Y C5,15-methyltransferase (decarboxylating) [Antricoccus suffuscus]|uniref:Precorrin-6Y C5,15-methyltransferase (Decarboxylating) n=1 Tax=Antricoccus suffuscus TaxID=1629062 RepID=A0A2T1A075_9ACTN|nr:precorrin-6y C5,15-methyltransferase (decarboxylating) subunit CbiE [Antricoccus suffuscus]PRZ41738.1 precorrin-6Y C5,15-methyltransferase (decarboxylating) [Antricoccus suffuscus]